MHCFSHLSDQKLSDLITKGVGRQTAQSQSAGVADPAVRAATGVPAPWHVLVALSSILNSSDGRCTVPPPLTPSLAIPQHIRKYGLQLQEALQWEPRSLISVTLEGTQSGKGEVNVNHTPRAYYLGPP